MNEPDKTLAQCEESLHAFDSKALGARNHFVHWLRAVALVRLGRLNAAQDELSAMDVIIAENKISAKRYNVIYKFRLHLAALLAAERGSLKEVDGAAAEFDGPIHTKVKDHGSPFDLAFFNTEFGKIYLTRSQPERAEKRFKAALSYNPNYAAAHFFLANTYKALGREAEGRSELDTFNTLWKDADPKATPQ
jgi:predicted Zn-dependent protease